MERGLVFGLNIGELLTIYDHDSQLWKMSGCLFTGDYAKYSEAFPRSGIMLSGRIYEQATWAQRTKGKESGLWPTPQASDGEGGIGHSPKAGGMNLRTKVATWPTPEANCGKRGSQPKIKAGPSVLMPTYTINQAVRDRTGKAGKLNPVWVEWLMGYPAKWTDLKDSEMRLSLK